MNALSNELNLKLVVCGAVAVVLTAVSSWSFVHSTATTTAPVVQMSQESLGDVVIEASRLVAQNSTAVLLD